MSLFEISGVYTPREFLEEIVAREFQFEVKNAVGKKLLVVFHKGIWAIQNPATREYALVYDSLSVPDADFVTVGLCDEDEHKRPNTFWIGYLRQQLDEHYHKAGEVLQKGDLDKHISRTVPAKAIASLIEMVLGADIAHIHIVKKERNGVIRNGQIVS